MNARKQTNRAKERGRTKSIWKVSIAILMVSAVLLSIAMGMLSWFVLVSGSFGSACGRLSPVVLLLQQAIEKHATLGQRVCDAYLAGSEFCKALPSPAGLDPAAIPWRIFSRSRKWHLWPAPSVDKPFGLRP